MDILGKALHLCFHMGSVWDGKQQADEMGCRRGVKQGVLHRVSHHLA